MEGSAMFWGVILKPEKRYEQMVEESFHISKACVEPSTAEGGKVTTVYLEKDSEEFIICNLRGPNSLNENLDLNFNFGEKICFRVDGAATVHLTGYLVEPDDDPDYEEDDSMMMDSMLGASDDEEEEDVPQLVKKRKHPLENGTSPADGQQKKKKKVEQSALDKLVEEAKKSKAKEVKQAKAAKASLLSGKAEATDEEDMDDEDSDDDEEVYLDDSNDGEGEEEEDEDELDDEESDEGEEEEEEDEEEETKAQKPGKKQSNASPKKPLQSPASAKKGQRAATPVAKKGTPVPKKPTPATPNDKGDAETPKSKKKNKENIGDNKMNGSKEGAKTPKTTLKGGLVVEDLKVGNGPEAAAGKFVGMYYEGKLKAGGKTFDSCQKGKPFKFKLGQGEVIRGWDAGILGMKVGGKRRLTVPPKMAYGSEGAAPDIPPNAVLVFDVECKAVN